MHGGPYGYDLFWITALGVLIGAAIGEAIRWRNGK